MTGEEAHAILSRSCAFDVGRFYGNVGGLGLGAGLIYADVRCPMFDPEDDLFLTVEKPAYVMTHECDVDSGNDRSFSDHVLICPLIPIADLAAEYHAEIGSDEQFTQFLKAVAQRKVNRLAYVPPGPGVLALGAVAYLNNLTNTHIKVFKHAVPLAAVSAFGLQEIDFALTRHMLRPKADALSFMPPQTVA